MQGILFAILIGLQLIILLSLWTLLYQLVKQQGRILLRLDELDGRGGRAAEGRPVGLEVGTPVPSFRLPDLERRMISMEDLRGWRVLLVYWSPGCGFCELIAPDLAALQDELRVSNVQLVMVSLDGAEANRSLAASHGLKGTILLAEDVEASPIGDAFHQLGTPVAYLLDERGRVARPPAVGADAVPELAREAIEDRPGRKRLAGERPRFGSRIERDGLKAGTPAPAFLLPDLAGRTVSLEDYRGRPVVLVFTDPNCGPCEDLAPRLVDRHRQLGGGGPAVLVVSRGDVDEIRRKARRHGIAFPVLVQDRWQLSTQYGIFEIPVAFLIDERGVIARGVARGVDEILELIPRVVVAAGS